MQGCCADKSCTPETCMNLPEGVTCGDCFYEKLCCTMFGHRPEDTYCDWFPRRFIEKSRAKKHGKQPLFTAKSDRGWRTSISLLSDGSVQIDAGSGAIVTMTIKDVRKIVREHNKAKKQRLW